MVLLSITPLLDGVLRLDIIAPFHTSGPPLLQFHLAIEQWGIVYAEQGYIIVTLPLAYSSNKYVVIGQDLDYTSNDTDGYGENVGVTQVTTTSIRVSITRGRYLSYCTIGF